MGSTRPPDPTTHINRRFLKALWSIGLLIQIAGGLVLLFLLWLLGLFIYDWAVNCRDPALLYADGGTAYDCWEGGKVMRLLGLAALASLAGMLLGWALRRLARKKRP